ncbi:hypothetical protein [Nocardia sp. MDA0666]|nr:hypothetical protein [Nocardia sp. MDA0666]
MTTMERERNRLSSAINSLALALDKLDGLIDDVNRSYLAEHPDSAVAR